MSAAKPKRLRPGELDGLVLSFMHKHEKDLPMTPRDREGDRALIGRGRELPETTGIASNARRTRRSSSRRFLSPEERVRRIRPATVRRVRDLRGRRGALHRMRV